MLQQSKDVKIGASFGTSTTGMFLSSNSSSNCVTRMTVVLAILFFFISLILGNFSSNNKNKKDSDWINLDQPIKSKQPKTSVVPTNTINDIPQ
ncbi:preprotein translocase IISP family, auxillary membrane component [Serratia symbiotica str. 'Cinara cedri']|nr:preprotein translocase IISP family, auxillary membrane component [Serratia symbiotica str. 'Cinara cedri']